MESKPFKSMIKDIVNDAKPVEPDAFWWLQKDMRDVVVAQEAN